MSERQPHVVTNFCMEDYREESFAGSRTCSHTPRFVPAPTKQRVRRDVGIVGRDAAPEIGGSSHRTTRGKMYRYPVCSTPAKTRSVSSMICRRKKDRGRTCDHIRPRRVRDELAAHTTSGGTSSTPPSGALTEDGENPSRDSFSNTSHTDSARRGCPSRRRPRSLGLRRCELRLLHRGDVERPARRRRRTGAHPHERAEERGGGPRRHRRRGEDEGESGDGMGGGSARAGRAAECKVSPSSPMARGSSGGFPRRSGWSRGRRRKPAPESTFARKL